MKPKLNITLLVILICAFLSSCQLKTDKSLLNNWTSYPILSYNQALKINQHSTTNWVVYLKNDSLHVIDKQNYKNPSVPFIAKTDSNRVKLRGEISIMKVNDGYLIGSFRGEWGGDLYWFSDDGSKSYKISDDEIVQFIKNENKLYAIQGLNDGGISEGSVLTISKKGNKWVAKETLKLLAAPYAIALDSKQNFIIITSASLLKVDKKLNVTVLVDKGLWYNYLYVNSLIIKDDVIYAGMPAGVYKYSLITKNQEWLQEK